MPTLSYAQHDRANEGLLYVYTVLSRRAGGVSLGINLNPNNSCNWRCVYCQVPDLQRGRAPPIDLDRLRAELQGLLHQIVHGDYLQTHAPAGLQRLCDIALSGNGEPSSAAEFGQVIELLGEMQARFALPHSVRLRVITNGSLLGQARVQNAIARLAELGGEVWFKADGARAEDFLAINSVTLAPQSVARNLAHCAALCPTWVQTCVFAREGRGPGADWLAAYLDLLRQLDPKALRGVLLYGLARPSQQQEAAQLTALPQEELTRIADAVRALGLEVRVSQ